MFEQSVVAVEVEQDVHESASGNDHQDLPHCDERGAVLESAFILEGDDGVVEQEDYDR